MAKIINDELICVEEGWMLWELQREDGTASYTIEDVARERYVFLATKKEIEGLKTLLTSSMVQALLDTK